MIGTVITAYFTGIGGGIAAAVFSTLISSSYDVMSLIYMPTSVMAAILIHFFIKRGYLNNILKAVVSSFWLGIFCTVVSTPLNMIFYNGYSGNVWGDTLVDMMRWYDISSILSALAGEAVVEILDKQICVLVAFLILSMCRYAKKGTGNRVKMMASVLVMGMVTSMLMPAWTMKVKAESSFDNNYAETIYNNTNGLVSSEANTICETDDGYIWIGSYAGLTRYDGKEFEFIREGGLVNVVEMVTDSKGRLWIGTNDAGIARYENGVYTYFTEEDGLPSNSVRCFAEDSEGNMYVGTSDKICKFTADDTIEVAEWDIVFAKVMTVYNDMLIVLDNMGCLYALNDEYIETMGDFGTEELFYYCLGVTSKGLMVGTETGEFFLVDVSDEGLYIKEQLLLYANEISAIYEDSQQCVWVATEDGFGYIDEESSYYQLRYDEFNSSIVDFHEDYQGNMWIASSDYGVMKLSESSFVNIFEKAGLENQVVNAVICYNGDYYCGTDAGLFIIDSNDFSIKTNELTELLDGFSRVRSMFIDSEEQLWICTYNGLIRYNSIGEIVFFNQESQGTTSDRFRCITECKDGTIVTGTADGINFIKDGELTGTLTAKNGLANAQILSIVEGKDGRIWAGSDGSGIYLIEDGKLVDTYSTADGLSSDVILRIVPHEDGYLVVTSNALCHIDLNGKIKKLKNFPYFNNYDIIIVDETAYITCSAGIYQMKLDELCEDNVEQFRLYNANEGLLSGLTANSWNYIGEDGKLYLCSNTGVVIFDSNSNRDTDMKYGIVSVVCDGEEFAVSGNSFMIPAEATDTSIFATVRNYAFADVKVRFYIKELEKNPSLYAWDEIEPVHISKQDFAKYTLCMEILDSTGETVLQEKEYIVSKDIHAWENLAFKTYLIAVCLEIFIFSIISIVSMVLFVTRKNQLEILQVQLEEKVHEQTEELRVQQDRIKQMFVQTVMALSGAVDAKDRYTSGHSKRVAEYARMIAARMGKSKEEQEEIYRAGLLHDVGKIRIPGEIINKPGKLTDEEFNTIKLHPVTGYHILRKIADNNFIAIAAKYHHERYDGKGYPNGLSGENIPEVARILGVADSYDAMASNRSYRKALPQEVVRSEIEKGKGTQFDPYIADIMLQMIDEDKNYSMKQEEASHKKVLVVDDEAMNVKIIALIMQDESMYEIVPASGGKEALRILKEQSIDLILLDIIMPEMDGWETLQLIRKEYDMPVVIMSADKEVDMSAGYAERGYDDYITKPVLPLVVKEIVHNMTEQQR